MPLSVISQDLKQHRCDCESSQETGSDSAAGVWREGSNIEQGGLTDLSPQCEDGFLYTTFIFLKLSPFIEIFQNMHITKYSEWKLGWECFLWFFLDWKWGLLCLLHEKKVCQMVPILIGHSRWGYISIRTWIHPEQSVAPAPAVLTLPPPGTCLILSLEPQRDVTWLKSSFLCTIWT